MAAFSALIVDDDPEFRDSMALLVGREGYRVREAPSLTSARSRLAESPPDVVFVDLRLPDGDGLELILEEGARSNTSFVVVTGNASVDSAVDALRKGALDYLTKPADADEILRAFAPGGADEAEGSEPAEDAAAPSLHRVEWEHIQRVLAACGGNVSRAARRLGLHRRTLQRKLATRPPLR